MFMRMLMIVLSRFMWSFSCWMVGLCLMLLCRLRMVLLIFSCVNFFICCLVLCCICFWCWSCRLLRNIWVF